MRFRWTGTSANSGNYRIDDFSVQGTSSNPTIIGTATATAFTTTYGSASIAQNFTVSGSNLTANITATAPTGFEVSNDGLTYAGTAAFTQSGGSASGTLRIRLAATAAVGGSYNGVTVPLTSTGATTVNITTAASGNTVTAKALTISGLTGVNKTYDGTTTATYTGTPAYSGLVNSESFSVSGTPSATFDNSAAGTGKAVTVSGITAPSTNYAVSPPTVTANVDPAMLTITANNVTKPIGNTLSSPVTGSTAFTSSGLVSPETIGSVTITYGSGADAGDQATTYVGQVLPSAATGGSFTAANYTISYVAGDIVVSANPTITVTGALAAVDTTYGTASASPTSFTTSGGNVTGDLTVTVPTGFEASTSAGSGYATTLTLTATSGNVPTTTIFVRLAATAAAGTYSGNISVSGGGAVTQNVPTVSSTVAPKSLTISGLSGENKIYDRNTTATVAGTPILSGIVGSDDVTLSGTPAFEFANALVGTGKTIMASGYTLSGSTAPNYSLTQPTGLSGDIIVKSLTLTGAAVTTKAFNGNANATITGTLSGVISPDVVTLSGTGTFADANVGTGIAVTSTSNLGGADAANYSLTQPVGLTGEITQAPQTITFGTLAARTTADAPFNLTATASSNLTATYASSNTAVATVFGNTVTIVGAGTTTITASQAGNGNVAAATPVDQVLTVTPGPTTLAAGDVAVIGYNTDGSPDTIALLILKDLNAGTVFYVNDNEVSADGGTTFTDLNEAEGSFTIKSGQSVAKGSVIILTWGSAASTTTYDWSTGSGGLGSNNEELYIYTASSITATTPTAFIYYAKIGTSTSARPSGLTAGTTFISPTGAASRYKTSGATYSGTAAQLLSAIGNTATNWEATAPVAAGDWTFLFTAPQTITFGSLATRTFGDAAFTLGATASSGLAVTYASSNTNVATVAGNTVTIVGAGSTNITASQAGNSTFAPATPVVQALTVNKADQTITGLAATDSKTYGDAAYSLAASASSALSVSYASSNTAVATISGSTVTIVGAGSTTITASQAGNANYNPANAVDQTLTVSAAALTITANNLTKVFGATLTSGSGSLAFTPSGLIGTEAVGSVTITYGSGAAAGDAPGVYSGQITPSAATGGTFNAANYTITYVAGDITVSSSPTIIVGGTLTAVNTTYGTASATPTSFTVAGGNLSGDLTVSAPAGFEVSSVIGSGYGPTLDLSPTIGTLASSTIFVRLAATTAAGTYAGNVTVSGGGATPQNVSTVSSAVGQKGLSIIGLTGENKIYDRTTDATASGTATLSGVVGSDDVSPSGSPEFDFDTTAVGTTKAITATGFTLSGTAAANYSVTQPTGLSADIIAKSLTITGAAVTTKVFDGNTNASITGSLSGVVSPDAVTFQGIGTFADANVGTGIAVTSTSTLGGAAAANYSLTQPVSLTGEITRAPQTITFGTLAARTTADAPFVLTATASSGLAVSYASSNTAVATISGSMVTIVGVGTSTITASQAGNSNYNPAVDVPQTLTVTTALAAGDVAFTAFQSDNSGGSFAGDAFEFVLLVPVTTGTTLFFTDNGYQTDVAKFRTNESMVRWVAQSDLPAGTVKQFVAPGGTGSASTAEWTGINSLTGATLTTAALVLSTGGDNITALQNPIFASEAVTGTVIAQITFGGSTFAATHTTASGNATTGLAGGLTDGVNALSLAGTDNGRYNAAAVGSIESGTKATVAASINTDSYWQTSGTPYTPGGANTTFTIASLATVSTGTVGLTTRTTSTVTGNDVSADGNSAITERGVVFSTSANPTIADMKVVVSGTTGSFDANLTGLVMNTPYFARAFATNSAGTAYGADVSFTTLANNLPTFTGMSVPTFKDGPIDILRTKILAKSSDVDGDTVTISEVTSVTAQAGTATLGATAITYTPASGFSGTDTISFTFSDGFGTVNHTITVTVSEDPLFTSAGNAPTIDSLDGGAKRIAFFGIPGRTYAIQRSTDMAPGSWTQIAAVTAAANSTATFDDLSPPQPSAFYRIAFPAQ